MCFSSLVRREHPTLQNNIDKVMRVLGKVKLVCDWDYEQYETGNITLVHTLNGCYYFNPILPPPFRHKHKSICPFFYLHVFYYLILKFILSSAAVNLGFDCGEAFEFLSKLFPENSLSQISSHLLKQKPSNRHNNNFDKLTPI